jgi:hypothetical protein
MTQAMRCYDMAERRAAGHSTHTPIYQYPETIFDRERRRLAWWASARKIALLVVALVACGWLAWG